MIGGGNVRCSIYITLDSRKTGQTVESNNDSDEPEEEPPVPMLGPMRDNLSVVLEMMIPSLAQGARLVFSLTPIIQTRPGNLIDANKSSWNQWYSVT